MSKGQSAFCYPENIERETKKLFRMLDGDVFQGGAKRADFIAAASERKLPRARRELKAVRREVAKLRAETAALRSDGLRAGISPFVDAWHDYARAADRYVSYYERAISEDKPKERRLRQGIEDAAQRVQRVERPFREAVLRAVSGS